MAVFSDWRKRLTPFDSELFLMIESLTGKEVKPRATNDNSYFVCVDYSCRADVDFINAVMDAIAGRVGDRLIRFDDYPDESRFLATIRFSEDVYPAIMRLETDCKPKPFFGEKYADLRPGMDAGAWVLAVRVDRETASRLLSFVGSGEFEIPKEGPATFHFANPGGIWQHAPEGSYVVYSDRTRLFSVIGGEIFEMNFEKWRNQS